jgi:hypothetical protein
MNDSEKRFRSPEDNEDELLNRATSFRATRYVGTSQERIEVSDYAEALRLVWPIWQLGGRATIHCFTDNEWTLLPKERTNHFGNLWIARKARETEKS